MHKDTEIGISAATAQRLRDELAVWERGRFQTVFHTATAWIEHTLPAAEVERCGAAVSARVMDREDCQDSTACWKWVCGVGRDIHSHTEDEVEQSDTFWDSLGVRYDEFFGWGFLCGIEDAYEKAFCAPREPEPGAPEN